MINIEKAFCDWNGSVKARKSCTLEGAVDAVARGYTLLSNPWLQLPIDSYLPDAACPATLATIPEDDGRIMSLHTTPPIQFPPNFITTY